MTNEDYIRTGVELADGFDLTDGQLTFPSGHFTYVTHDTFPQHYIDALAAQLVREVISTGVAAYAEGYSFVTGDKAILTDLRDPFEQTTVEGPDRTMNTIKAIVDSGVLSND